MNLQEFIYTVLLKPRFLKKSANWILKKIIPVKVQVGKATLYLNPDDPVISGALTLGLFENDEIKIFEKFFQPGMTLLDVGANVGLYSSMALSADGFCGKVICMEPHNESRRYLEKNISTNRRALPDQNVVVSALAASDFDGDAVLYENPENKGDNRLYADNVLGESEKIAVTTIDKLCAENNIDRVDFIKIDIQGAEGKAISGATQVLANSQDCVILSEFWPYGLSRCGSSAVEYLQLLQKLGFSVFKLGKKCRLSPLDIDEIMQNYQGRKYTNIVGIKGKYLQNALA